MKIGSQIEKKGGLGGVGTVPASHVSENLYIKCSYTGE